MDIEYFKALPYLLYLVKKEKEHETISTSTLAKEFGFSQQTASRLLRDLESKGFIQRTVTSRGQVVEITKKGRELLLVISSELDSVLKEPVKISFKGKLVSGSGEGAYYMSRKPYVKQFKHLLGYIPFPGTLNVELCSGETMKKARLTNLEHVFIRGFKTRGRAFGSIRCYSCVINGKVNGHILIPERTHHPESIIEIISENNLREYLSLKEGDEIIIDVISV